MKKKPKKLKKMSQKGFRGFPVATVAYYGPTDKLATKVAVGIIAHEGADPVDLNRWFTETVDIRMDETINTEIIQFIKANNVKSVVAADRIMGCPHEEGVDYPEGEKCPECPFGAMRDRFTGEIIQ